jgi:hypothetical protein
MSRARRTTNPATRDTARPRLGVTGLLHRRLAVVALWYLALALGLLVTLLLTALYTPSVVLHVLTGAPELAFLTPAEASHMRDVHVLVRDALLLAISALVVLTSYAWLRTRDGIALRDVLDRGMTRGALAMQLTLCVLLIPFPWTFTRFHEAFFPQGNWQFAADSWLITTYPQWFFALAAIGWFGGTAIALWLLHRRAKRA